MIYLIHFTLIALRIFLLQELAHSLRRFKQSATQSTAEKKLCNQQTITCETADSFIWIWDMTQESTTSPCHLPRVVLQDKPNLSRRIFFFFLQMLFFFFYKRASRSTTWSWFLLRRATKAQVCARGSIWFCHAEEVTQLLGSVAYREGRPERVVVMTPRSDNEEGKDSEGTLAWRATGKRKVTSYTLHAIHGWTMPPLRDEFTPDRLTPKTKSEAFVDATEKPHK